MSTYDQLALSTKPAFYLASPLTTDQSGTSTFTIDSNTSTLDGQPIIFGHESSFRVDGDQMIEISGDMGIFRDESTIELVVYCSKPEDEIPLLTDVSTGSGVYLTNSGVALSLSFDYWRIISPTVVSVDVLDWDQKLHIVINFMNNQAELNVNSQSAILDYVGDPVTITDCKIGSGILSADQSFFMDGLGVYFFGSEDKSSYINDDTAGYPYLSSRKYNGINTVFSGNTVAMSSIITSEDFTFFDAVGQESFAYYQVPATEDDKIFDFVTVKNSNENIILYYRINQESTWTQIIDNTIIDIDEEMPLITFKQYHGGQRDKTEFQLKIDVYFDGGVTYQTPANLTSVGGAVYPDKYDASIVNCPSGVILKETSYSGEWIAGQFFEDVPKTIEIVFKPENVSTKTYVFNSTDGSASFGPSGSITGYTAFLNGQVVTDLNDVRENQWYHLVLVDPSPSDTTFTLNSPDSNNISYMILAGYQDELVVSDALILYKALVGTDNISHTENLGIVQEYIGDTGTAYTPYSYAWSIIGAGGN